MGAEEAVGNADDISARTRSLSLRALDDQIVLRMPTDTVGHEKGSQIAGWSMLIGGALITFISALALPAQWAAALVWIGLAVEVAGGAYLLFLQLRSMKIGRLRQEFASELDFDFAAQLAIVAWLRSHDARELSDKLRFVRVRVDSITRKLGVLLGSVEKLGMLPVVVAVYLQFRDIKLAWPPTLNLAEFLLGLLVMGLYAAGILGISLRLRLNLYEILLEEALHESNHQMTPAQEVGIYG